jgi:hypothetical protein
MWHRKSNIFIYILIFIICSSCYVHPYYAIYYVNLDFPMWDAKIWSRDDELWRMRRGYGRSWDKRDEKIVKRYILNGALCYVYIFAKNMSTTSSNNPYQLGISVHGISGQHYSYTIKQVSINSVDTNVSRLINNNFPVTIILENEFEESTLVKGFYYTDYILILKKEKIIVTATLEINGINGAESRDIVFELSPSVKAGLFHFPSH